MPRPTDTGVPEVYSSSHVDKVPDCCIILFVRYANGGQLSHVHKVPDCYIISTVLSVFFYQSSRCLFFLKVAGIAVKLLLPLLRDFPTHHAEPTLHCSGKTL